MRCLSYFLFGSVPACADGVCDAVAEVVFEESDGGEARIAAFRVADDPVLSALMRDHDALTGDYARAVRSGYRSVFRP